MKLLPDDQNLILSELRYDSKKLKCIKDDSFIRDTQVVIFHNKPN
jgi:hypothetical protein